MKPKNSLTFLILICGLISSCGTSNSNSSKMTPINVACNSTNPPVYTNDVEFILKNNCSSCHSGFDSYSGALGSAASIETQVFNGTMPRNSSLTAADKDAVVQWVACGSKQ